MKIIDYYEFKIPEYFLCAIVNSDYTSLNNEEISILENFLSELPNNGIWEFEEESYFSYSNSIDRMGCNVIDCKYNILGE